VSWEKVLPVLGCALFMIGGYAVAQLHSKWLGLLMWMPVAGYALVEVVRTPREKKAQLAAVVERHERKPLVRPVRIIELAALVLLVATVLRWLHGQL
jgi:hypothetical protein